MLTGSFDSSLFPTTPPEPGSYWCNGNELFELVDIDNDMAIIRNCADEAEHILSIKDFASGQFKIVRPTP